MFLINFDSEIEERIEIAINKLSIKSLKKPLFGAIVSNRARHIERVSSDYDFFLICDFYEEQKEVVILKDITKDVDFLVFDINALKKESKRYFATLKKFPSFEVESQKKLSSQQADYYVMPIFECLCSDFLWDSGYVKENVRDLLSMIDIRNVLDYFYSRICGNYEKIISGKRMPVIKYLTTLNGIWMMKSLLAKHQIVNLNTELLGECHLEKDSILYKSFKKMMQLNSGERLSEYSNDAKDATITESKKEQIFIERDELFVKYFQDEVEHITSEMQIIQGELDVSVAVNMNLYEYFKESL